MKTPLRSIAIAAVLGVVLTLLSQVAAAPSEPSFGKTFAADSYVPGEVLVKFKPAYSTQHRMSAVAIQGHAVLADLNQPGWVQVKIGAGQTMAQVLASYQNNPDVEYVQPNYIYQAAAVPNDTRYGELWAFKNLGVPGADINIEKAWDHRTDCSIVVVAVIDTGVNYNQEDLASNMWNGGPSFPNHGTDSVSNDNDPMDLHGHGTHIAGIIGAAGNNAKGVTGICWRASIMAVRVLDAGGRGTTAGVIQGISFAVSHGAKLINISFSGDAFDQAFSNAITNAQANDVVVIVAAGNEANNNDGGSARYPCNFIQPNLVCVAALDQNYALANFSNWGATSVDVGAPGTNILSAWAGAQATISDDFKGTGGVLDWTTSGGWAYSQLTLSGSPVDVLVNPASFPSGTYANNADNRVYKAFDLSGKTSATLSLFIQYAIQPGDFLNINYRTTGGDPFANGVFLDGGNGASGGVVGPFSYDISPCISATCSVGFQLVTNASVPDQGVGILFFSIETLQLNNTSYNTIDGTSMATPMVTGLAAMLRAYNPQYNYTDVVNAIKNGGRPIAALSGKTTTGKAIDVMSSLAYINPPAGLRATVGDAEQ
jgi:thermitase